MKNSTVSAEPIDGLRKLVSAKKSSLGSHEDWLAEHSQGRVHVLFIIDQICRIGGAERALLEIVRGLPSDRFRCTVLTFQADQQLKALESISKVLRVLSLKRTYDFDALRAALELRKLIQTENVSIVHTFFETSDLWAAPIARLSGCPVLISSRRDMGILRKRKHHLAYPFVNPIFDCILAVSEEVRNYALHHDGLPADRVETLYNGVDLKVVDVRREAEDLRLRQGLNPGTLVISTLANIRHIKGIDVLVRAAARVSLKNSNAVFLVAGGVLEPETFTRLQELVALFGIKDRFRFLGAMSNPYPLLAGSDVFCLPSRNEGFSNALLEAMSSSLPCVATRVGGNAEALNDGVNGFVVESEDAGAMADRILQLLRDPELRRRMGRLARQTVEASFSMDKMMARLTAIYEHLLAAK